MTNESKLTQEEKQAIAKKKKDCARPVERAQKLPKDKPYFEMIKPEIAKPLSVFLRALGNKDCSELMFDFLQAPFITARTAGVPYAAALVLGSGDWDSINAALMAENDQRRKLVAQVTGSLGPVWVRAR